jgi:hypothetical protein
MMPYQINANLLAGSNAYVMHDMPIHRGYEIDAETINSTKSVIFEQEKTDCTQQSNLLNTDEIRTARGYFLLGPTVFRIIPFGLGPW